VSKFTPVGPAAKPQASNQTVVPCGAAGAAYVCSPAPAQPQTAQAPLNPAQTVVAAAAQNQTPPPAGAQTTAQPSAQPRAYTHLNYGGSINPTGALGPKPQRGRQFRTQKRLETIVRLENAGFTPQQMAPMLGVSIPRIKSILQTPAYLNARIKITHGIIVDHDASLAEIKSQRREMLTQMLPAAFQVLANELLSSGVTIAERKHKVAVAQDLLDREGSLAKISRAEVKPVDQFDFEKADAASAALLQTIRGIAPAPTEVSEDVAAALAANLKFANSHTLSAVDQQSALDKLEAEASKLSADVLEAMMTGASDRES
jgi:hypothetical protein